VEQGEKWKSELQGLKNWIIGVISNVKQRRGKLKGQWKSMKRKIMALKWYKMGDGENCRSGYCSCIMEYEKLLEEKEVKDGRTKKKSEQMNH